MIPSHTALLRRQELVLVFGHYALGRVEGSPTYNTEFLSRYNYSGPYGSSRSWYLPKKILSEALRKHLYRGGGTHGWRVLR